MAMAGNPFCDCSGGVHAVMRRSGTQGNPDRRFWTCVNKKKDGGGCGFFKWVDGDTSQSTSSATHASRPAVYDDCKCCKAPRCVIARAEVVQRVVADAMWIRCLLCIVILLLFVLILRS